MNNNAFEHIQHLPAGQSNIAIASLIRHNLLIRDHRFYRQFVKSKLQKTKHKVSDYGHIGVDFYNFLLDQSDNEIYIKSFDDWLTTMFKKFMNKFNSILI